MHPSTASHIRDCTVQYSKQKIFVFKNLHVYIYYLSDMTRYAREFYKFLSEHIKLTDW